MKKLILLGALASVFALQSCSESNQCQCVRETAEALKKSRESDYKDAPAGGLDSPGCLEVAKEMKNKSKKEQKAATKEMEECSAYADLKKERELWQKYLQKQFEESMKNIGPGN